MNWKKGTSLVLAGVMASSVLFAGCGKSIDKDAVVATLGDKEISLGFANFMAQYQAITYDRYFLSMYGEDMWNQDIFGNGSTMTETVKDGVLESIEMSYLLEQHMEEYKVEITDDELSAMQETAKQFMEDNSKGAIKALGAEEEYVTEMLRLSMIQTKMQGAIQSEADTEVSDEEAAQRTFSYIQINANSYTDDDGNSVDYTEEEKEELAEKAENVAKAAADDFDGAAADNDYTVSTYSYGADEDNSTMDEAVTSAADKLKEGEVSDLITTEAGTYYIIRLDSEFDEEATETKRESIIDTRKSEHYTEITDGYKEAAEWNVNEKVWEAVNFDELYTVYEEESTEAVEETEN